MQLALMDEIAWKPYPGTRTNTTKYKGLLQGKGGSVDNYEMAYEEFGEGGAISPRHRHNFDQFRWAFDEPLNYSPKLDIPPGQLGYFPEGAYYGPQHIADGCHMLIVQFGGASGAGYLGWDDLMRGTEELKRKGEFVRGVYTSTNAEGKRFNKDAYEAVWEHMQGGEVRYPVARYREPVVINPDAFAWRAVPNAPGVGRREFGTFNERGTAAFQLKVDAGSRYRHADRPNTTLFFVVSGTVTAGDEVCLRHSAVAISPFENVEICGLQDAVVLGFVMPDFSDRDFSDRMAGKG